jgi:hypothetical protein
MCPYTACHFYIVHRRVSFTLNCWNSTNLLILSTSNSSINRCIAKAVQQTASHFFPTYHRERLKNKKTVTDSAPCQGPFMAPWWPKWAVDGSIRSENKYPVIIYNWGKLNHQIPGSFLTLHSLLMPHISQNVHIKTDGLWNVVLLNSSSWWTEACYYLEGKIQIWFLEQWKLIIFSMWECV